MDAGGSTNLDELKEAVLTHGRSRDPSFLDLATSLLKLKTEDTGTFRETAIQAGLSLRRAYYLAKVAKQLQPLIKQRLQLAEIGWTKLAVIADHMAGKNPGKEKVARWMKLAKQHTIRELRVLLQDEKAPPVRGKPDPKTRCVLIYLDLDQYRTFKEVMIQHGAKQTGRGLSHQDQALMKVIDKANAHSSRDRPG